MAEIASSTLRPDYRSPRLPGEPEPTSQDVLPPGSTILVLGSGPIVIGQAAEFDFSGSQACRALREADYRVVLVNSNPATIQTDPGMADSVYIEPLTVAAVRAVIIAERPQGLLAGMGGQSALNLAIALAEAGVLEEYNVRVLGTSIASIIQAEDRDLFARKMLEIGEPIPKSIAVNTIEEALVAAGVLGFPCLIRPAYTLGGSGGGVAHDQGELTIIATSGLRQSRINQVLIEESVVGWKEIEYEILRDAADTVIAVCSMENLDPMGIHTGDSIVVAPVLTLSDRDHQMLRSASLRIVSALGIEGGCNVQLALDPHSDQYRVIEVNPRVSRSSALASKATGYPIARIATEIALGRTLDRIANPTTGTTSAAFEPALDYVVVKIPRWPFEKFPGAHDQLGTQMKSTGEVMAIGRTFEVALLKAIRSLERPESWPVPLDLTPARLLSLVHRAQPLRLRALFDALRWGLSVEEVAKASGFDRWFVARFSRIVTLERRLSQALPPDLLREAKRLGLSDDHIAYLTNRSRSTIADLRRRHAILPVYNTVDTCAAEFKAATPFYYSAYGDADEVEKDDRETMVVLGSGPIRIGQGIEFDYSCVHAVQAIRASGRAAVIINNNPETVSTDPDTADRLYFEPLTVEEVMAVLERERPSGLIVQFGGQTALNLAAELEREIRWRGLPTKILGTSVDAMDLAEDRARFGVLLDDLKIPQPPGGTALTPLEVRDRVGRLGYPVLLRPSHVLGGRAMEIIDEPAELTRYLSDHRAEIALGPLQIDRFLDGAIEIDVDAVCDGRDVYIGAVMEHIELAGVHSGDSSCVIPPQGLGPDVIHTIRDLTTRIALALGVVGMVNLQLALWNGEVYVLEANPRGSRTVPFVAKASGIPLARIGTRVMLGETLESMDLPDPTPVGVAVKMPVFPFHKLPGADPILSPEMKSTGEVMGQAPRFEAALAKAIAATGQPLEPGGTAYITVRDADKDALVPLAKRLVGHGFTLLATRGTADHLTHAGLDCKTVYRISEGQEPSALGLMAEGKVDLIINTPTRQSGVLRDGFKMRTAAVEAGIPFLTTLPTARAWVKALEGAGGVNEVAPLVDRS